MFWYMYQRGKESTTTLLSPTATAEYSKKLKYFVLQKFMMDSAFLGFEVLIYLMQSTNVVKILINILYSNILHSFHILQYYVEWLCYMYLHLVKSEGGISFIRKFLYNYYFSLYKQYQKVFSSISCKEKLFHENLTTNSINNSIFVTS